MIPGWRRKSGTEGSDFYETHCSNKKTRLGGIEPPHLPPEGSALSTELQTCIAFRKGSISPERFNYVITYFGKSKELIFLFSG